MAQPKLTLFLDPVSPFGYMAFHVVTTSATFKGCDTELVPVFLGGIMQSTGNKPPVSVPNKAAYLERDRARWVKRFKIPMGEGFPEPFPQPTIQASRALCAIQSKYPSKLEAAFKELFTALWIDMKPVGKPEIYSEYLARVFSKEEVADIVKQATEPDVKAALIKNTDRALELGCFGLPYYVATNAQGQEETFWGFDHIGEVIDHLGLKRLGGEFQAML